MGKYYRSSASNQYWPLINTLVSPGCVETMAPNGKVNRVNNSRDLSGVGLGRVSKKEKSINMCRNYPFGRVKGKWAAL